MSKFKTTLFLIAVNCLTICYSQKQYGHVSPTTADFMQYGEIPVSLYNGKMNFDIQIFRIKDKDFDIPINLVYTSDGFKPSKRAGFVGLDWMLDVGGTITREVYGVPDDDYPYSQTNELGFMSVVSQANYNKDLVYQQDPSVIYNFGVMYKYLKPIDRFLFCEYTPDLFMLNFLGNNERFMLNNEGGVTVSNRGYRVNISGLKTQHRYDELIPEVSKIEVVTPDAYRYVFGGDIDALEFSVQFVPNQQCVLDIMAPKGATNPTILAWHITEIIAPNGRSVKFKYKSSNINSINYSKNADPFWTSSRTRTYDNLTPDYLNYNYSATKNVFLESIEIDGTLIMFHSSVESTLGLNFVYSGFNPGYNDFNHACLQLDSVVVKHNNTLLYNYKLNYINVSKRRFLKEFIDKNNSKYIFDYDNLDSYPEPDVVNVDFWKYWKQNNSNQSNSLLKKVTYPTGGYTDFTYEPHDNNYIVKTFFGGLLYMNKQLVQEIYKVGGARIKEIRSFKFNGDSPIIKSYVYKNSNSNTGISSGIIYQFPPSLYNYANNNYMYYLQWQENYNIGEPHVGYSKVYEILNDGSYTEYLFSSYLTNPDDISQANLMTLKNDIDVQLLASVGVNKAVSNSKKRGLINENIMFDKNGVLKQKDISFYRNCLNSGLITMDEADVIDVKQNDYIVSFRSVDGGGLSNKIFIEDYPIVIKKHISGNGIETNTQYTFNNYDLPEKTETYNSNKRKDVTTYKYPFDYSDTDTNCDRMVSTNEIKYLIEEKVFTEDVCVQTKRNVYKFTSSSLYSQLDSIKSSVYGGPFQTNMVIEEYDKYGNPIIVVDKDSYTTAYLWSYSGQVLIAEIKGANYSDVLSAIKPIFNITSINKLSEMSKPNEDVLRDGSLQRALPNSLVTTYTYRPLIGLSSITDPRGVTIYYEYDNSGRLKEKYFIENGFKNIIEKHDYYLQNQ